MTCVFWARGDSGVRAAGEVVSGVLKRMTYKIGRWLLSLRVASGSWVGLPEKLGLVCLGISGGSFAGHNEVGGL